LSRLVRDITRFAGSRAWLAAGLMFGAALLEGVGLLLLIPIVGVLISGPLDNMAGDLLEMAGATTPSGQLYGLLAGFLIAALLRAQIIHMRDILLARIQLGFSREMRIDVVSRLANAGWNRLASLNHAQVTTLINSDVGLVVVAAQFLLRIAVALLLILVSSLIAFSLAPGLVALLFAFVRNFHMLFTIFFTNVAFGTSILPF
jgi:ATP-binding cassette subfamily C protein